MGRESANWLHCTLRKAEAKQLITSLLHSSTHLRLINGGKRNKHGKLHPRLHPFVKKSEQDCAWWQNACRQSPDLQPHNEHHVAPHRFTRTAHIEHVKKVDIFQPCSLTHSEVTNHPQQNRTDHTHRGGDVRANSNRNCPPPRRPRSWRELQRRMGQAASQHSTAVSTLVRRSGLTVIGWEFEMDMTLGSSLGEARRRVKELPRHVGTAWKACLQADTHVVISAGMLSACFMSVVRCFGRG